MFSVLEKSLAQVALPSSEVPLQERRIILIGKLGAGKSHSGNGILGTQHFVSKRSWSSITRRCEYGTAVRDGFRYRIYDTPGVNSPQDLKAKVDVETDIKRCLFCTSPGFHAIVLVLSASERIAKEDLQMLQTLDTLIEESAFDYMILVITKLENDQNELHEMMTEAPDVVNLNVKCNSRNVIFGDDKKKIPKECVQKFDKILTDLIKENSRRGKEYYRHKYYDQATKILEKDMKDYMKDHPDTSESEAFEIVRNNAVEGRSPRDDQLKGLKDPRCATCSIS
jgi:hypothetical protein